MDRMYRHEMKLLGMLQEGVAEAPGVHIHGTRSLEHGKRVVMLTCVSQAIDFPENHCYLISQSIVFGANLLIV